MTVDVGELIILILAVALLAVILMLARARASNAANNQGQRPGSDDGLEPGDILTGIRDLREILRPSKDKPQPVVTGPTIVLVGGAPGLSMV